MKIVDREQALQETWANPQPKSLGRRACSQARKLWRIETSPLPVPVALSTKIKKTNKQTDHETEQNLAFFHEYPVHSNDSLALPDACMTCSSCKKERLSYLFTALIFIQ